MPNDPSPITPSPKSSLDPVRRGPGSIIAGATYPLRALRLFATQPQLRRYVIFPILVNVIVGVTLYAGLLFFGLRLIDSIMVQATTLARDLQAITPDVSQVSASVHSPTWLLAWEQRLGQAGAAAFGWLHWPAWLHWPSVPALSLPSGLSNAWQQIISAIAAAAERLGQSLSWLRVIPNALGLLLLWLLRVVLTLLLLLVTGFILLQFGVLLGSPWYGKLSEELERQKTGQAIVVEVGLVRDIWRAIVFELKKLAIALGLGVPLLALGFVPGLGPLITSVGSITVTGTLTCLDFLDAPLERRRLSFRRKLAIAAKGLPASATFGLVCLALVSVPFINLLAIPVCVAAGTLFVCDRVLPTLPPS